MRFLLLGKWSIKPMVKEIKHGGVKIGLERLLKNDFSLAGLNLSNTQLYGANLEGAELWGTNLQGAGLV